MAATYRASVTGGSTTGGTTTNAPALTTVAGDLLVVFCNASGNTNTAPTCTDGAGGSYTLVSTAAWGGGANIGSVFIRTTPVIAQSTTVTVNTGANTACQVTVVAYGVSHRYGLKALRQSGKQENQAGTTAPAFVAAGVVAEGVGALTPAYPVGYATNQIAILYVESQDQAVTLSDAQGFVALPDSPISGPHLAGSSTRLTAFWNRISGTGLTAPTIADPGDHMIAVILTFSGCVTSGNPYDVTASSGTALSSPSTSVSFPGDTTTVTNCLVVGAVASSLATSCSGYTNANLTSISEIFDTSTLEGHDGTISVFTGVMAEAGAFAATTATLANSSCQGRLTITLKPDTSPLTTPAPTLPVAALTGNATIAALFSADTTTTPPTSWTEAQDGSQITPTTALEVAYRNTGFTGTTITFGAVCDTAYASIAIELADLSAPAFIGVYPKTAAAMGTATERGATDWAAGWLFNETSGNLAPAFGTGTFTASGLAYSATGMLPGETAVTYGAGDSADAGAIYGSNAGAGDTMVMLVAKVSTGTGIYLVRKSDGSTGWAMQMGSQNPIWRVTNRFTDFPPTITYTPPTSPTEEWAVFLGVVDRSAIRGNFMMYAPSVGYLHAAGNTYSGDPGDDAHNLLISATAASYDALYLANGVDAALGLATGGDFSPMMEMLHSFVESLTTASNTGLKNLLLLGVG